MSRRSGLPGAVAGIVVWMVRRFLVLVGVNALVLLGLLVVLELGVRQLISYQIGYYVGPPTAGHHPRPYGDLVQNSLGHPDR